MRDVVGAVPYGSVLGERAHGVLPYGDEVCWEAGARSAPLPDKSKFEGGCTECPPTLIVLSSCSTNQNLKWCVGKIE